jgi:uncharacterized membrane protein YdjX (TVP38/TMEM64 family)
VDFKIIVNGENTMDIAGIKEFFTLENIEGLLKAYGEAGGPLLGIGIPLVESFFPFLPLVVIIMANAAAFGLWQGFIYSWIGSVVGSFLLFLLVRKYGQAKFFNFLTRHPHVESGLRWFEQKGFGPLFIILCFPFTPVIIVNVMSGLSKIKVYQFLLAITLSKIIMIFMMSYVGADFRSFIEKPIKALIAVVVLVVVWYIGKHVEKKLEFTKVIKD